MNPWYEVTGKVEWKESGKGKGEQGAKRAILVPLDTFPLIHREFSYSSTKVQSRSSFRSPFSPASARHQPHLGMNIVMEGTIRARSKAICDDIPKWESSQSPRARLSAKAKLSFIKVVRLSSPSCSKGESLRELVKPQKAYQCELVIFSDLMLLARQDCCLLNYNLNLAVKFIIVTTPPLCFSLLSSRV